MANLRHADLMKLGSLLGYKYFEGGLCRGFSFMWIQAVLAGEENKFFERLSLIAKYRSDFTVLKKEIELVKEKVKNKQVLDERSYKLLEILALFDGISLYFNPAFHQALFNKAYLTQENFDLTYPIVKSQMLEKNNVSLSLLMEKVYAFDRQSLKVYLTDLKKILKQTDSAIPILLEDFKHSTALKYNPAKDCWHFIDVNQMRNFSSPESFYGKEFHEDDLVDHIFKAFDASTASVVFTTKVFGNKQQIDETYKVSTSIDKDFLEFDSKYPIKARETSLHNSDGLGVLDLACRLNKVDALKQILQQSNVEINAKDPAGMTALLLACARGSKELVELLVEYPGIEIDMRDPHNQTPLYIACAWGNKDAAQILLETGKIDINAKGIRGYTAFQMVCQCAAPEIKETLLKLLLEHQANLAHVNNDNETALDNALKRNDKITISTLLNFIANHKINPYSVISANSLKTLIDQTKIDFPQFTDYLSSYHKKKNTLAQEVKDRLNKLGSQHHKKSDKENLSHKLNSYISNAKGVSLEGDNINIPLNCLPISKIKSMQNEFKKFLGSPSPVLMTIEHNTLKINLSASKSTHVNAEAVHNPSIDLLDWQIKFHTIYKQLNNKTGQFHKMVRTFLRECEELLRVNSIEGVVKPNLQIPKRLWDEYLNILNEYPPLKNGTLEKIYCLIEHFFKTLFGKFPTLSQYQRQQDLKNSLKFINHQNFFNDKGGKEEHDYPENHSNDSCQTKP